MKVASQEGTRGHKRLHSWMQNDQHHKIHGRCGGFVQDGGRT